MSITCRVCPVPRPVLFGGPIWLGCDLLMIYRQTWRVVWNEQCVLTGMWDNDNPAREFLLARRVYCSYVAVLLKYNHQVVLARQAMRIRLVSFYWPAELVIEKKFCFRKGKTKFGDL